MSAALQSVDGVTAVNVTHEGSRAKLALKTGNTLTLAGLGRLIETQRIHVAEYDRMLSPVPEVGGTHLTR